jgi:hypothetical protein
MIFCAYPYGVHGIGVLGQPWQHVRRLMLQSEVQSTYLIQVMDGRLLADDRRCYYRCFHRYSPLRV